ncbi:hypothetical protein C8J57DRAFT_1250576 [Mycena rebaudengoi]|nr:hypothetical protein C8J57DRAFT_1250576 [Mycena rebaudengoi]
MSPASLALIPKTPDTAQIFTATTLPLPNYAHMPISMPANSQDLKIFFDRERWIGQVQGLTPSEFQEAVRLPELATDGILFELRAHVLLYMKTINQFVADAMTRFIHPIAQVGMTSATDDLRTLQGYSLEVQLLTS